MSTTSRDTAGSRRLYLKSAGGVDGAETYILYELGVDQTETAAWLTSTAIRNVGDWR